MKKLLMTLFVLCTVFLVSTSGTKTAPIINTDINNSINQDLQVPCAAHFPFFTNCCGNNTLCALIDVTYDCNSGEVLDIYAFNYCNMPGLCDQWCNWI